MKSQTAENAYQATIRGMQEEIHNLQMRIAQLVTEKSEIQKELKVLRERVGLD
jgi:regulator of replication initiation timing